ncbi:uncharacterized protein SPSK_07996 [Sporothrix schenckii 1099-18]|uniref:Uncharacterized protein n=2 Tax=Sporothrix schenckii TaxID=29908 RepID=U7Q074_SPOS1|nr:uncharacterized protein SPSK_07996 [Sporothrix schenckii 1099-18]ERT01263.1 hypothetical protein HMPREF1624_02505 [Sporothrix schenckii ATCC 58251]KJR88420.1 hypothetical protein SPSK_07996 [Sporothrix schenckii 1099-18]
MMRLSHVQSLLLLAPVVFASPDKGQPATTTPTVQDDAASLVSQYVPASAYVQLTASVAAAASAASVTGDPSSLFLSALLATAPPAWFSSAVPPYFSSNIAALESAIAPLRSEAATLSSTATSETLVVTQTTNSQGSTVTTSYTSTFPVTTHTTSSSGNAAAPTASAQQQAGLGIAALALGLVAIF